MRQHRRRLCRIELPNAYREPNHVEVVPEYSYNLADWNKKDLTGKQVSESSNGFSVTSGSWSLDNGNRDLFVRFGRVRALNDF